MLLNPKQASPKHHNLLQEPNIFLEFPVVLGTLALNNELPNNNQSSDSHKQQYEMLCNRSRNLLGSSSPSWSSTLISSTRIAFFPKNTHGVVKFYIASSKHNPSQFFFPFQNHKHEKFNSKSFQHYKSLNSTKTCLGT